jgi:hypothetical protein
MTDPPGRPSIAHPRQVGRICVLALVTGVAAACGSSAPHQASESTPAAMRAACGRPGAAVTLKELPITVKKKVCDLTGVVIHFRDTGATVPESGSVAQNLDGVDSSAQLIIDVNAAAGTVRIHT